MTAGMNRRNRIVILTPTELAALSEAVRLAQETSHEGVGYHSTSLSRVQRKLGDEVGCGND